jgi:archaemetzincin
VEADGAIAVWWIGEREARREIMEQVRAQVARAFDAPVGILEAAARPTGTFDERRRQHSASRILAWLLAARPRGRVLGVTDVDLFNPVLTFVFGEAQLGGRAAVVSTARLLDGAARDPRVLPERLAKEAVHELGHALGLVHCPDAACAMSRSAGVRDVDRKDGALCRGCRARLREAGAGTCREVEDA